MIRIQADMKWLKIRAEGHAGYAETGKDIVCAGVSVLMETLLGRMLEEQQKTGDVQVTWSAGERGNMAVSVRAQPWRQSWARNLFDLTVYGLRSLAETYPEHVKIEIRKREKKPKA